ncbi:MAG: sigma-70 family RNA polymerase sigma factor [Clostridiales Family XIII bacterium]|nr:sigma-70 family RNA polymerase sigma factor [Clostridiales Family XIII bacterium]
MKNRLIARAKKGDKVAFEELYKENLKWIVYQVSNQLYDQTMIEDVAQDVAMKMWDNLKKLKSDDAFKVWLYRIIQNQCRTQNEMYKRVRYDADIETQENVIADDDVAALPEEAMVVGTDAEMLMELMQKLSELQRQTLLLYYYDGMKYKEIAEALGVSSSTVSTNIIAAKRNLKKMFEKNGITSIYIDDEADKKQETISLGAAIAMSSAAKAESVFAGVNVPAIVGGVHVKLGVVGAASKLGLSAKIGATKIAQAATIKVAAIVVGASLVTTGGVGAYVVTHDDVGTEPTVAAAAAVSETNIEILFTQAQDQAQDQDQDSAQADDADEEAVPSEVLAEHVNPTGADIVITGENASTAGAWEIKQESGAVLSSGSGSHIDGDVFSVLPAGKYILDWNVADADGSNAQAEREFEIAKIA